ncbi:MAG: glycosyltransferase family 4 protein [Bacteroidota bacterium]
MRIVFFANHFFPSIGGVQWSVLRSAEALASRGHDLTIITETPGDGSWDDEVLPFRVLRFQVPLRRPFTRIGYWMWMWRQREFLESSDVLHFHDYTTFFHWFLPLRLLIRSPRYAVTFHGFEHWPIRFRHRMFRAATAACCDVRFAVGEYVRQLYRHPVDAVYLGAPVRAFQQTPSASDAVFAYAGRLSEDTGILPLLTTLAIAARSADVSVRVRIAGDGPLRDAVAALGSKHLKVDILGESRNPQLALASARWVIATGFLGIFEAFTSGIPVISPAFNRIKQFYLASIPKSQELLSVLDGPESSQAFFASLLSGELEKELHEKSRKAALFVSEMTWDDIAILLESWYEIKRPVAGRPSTQLEIADARRQQ